MYILIYIYIIDLLIRAYNIYIFKSVCMYIYIYILRIRMVMEISPGNHRPPQQKGVPCRHFLIFGATKKALKTRYMLGCLPTQDHNDKQDDFTMYRNPITRWWQLKCFLFSSRFCGEMIQFDEHIVQMG